MLKQGKKRGSAKPDGLGSWKLSLTTAPRAAGLERLNVLILQTGMMITSW